MADRRVLARVGAVLVLLLFGFDSGVAQRYAELQPDSWVRVQSIDYQDPVVGIYLGLRQDSLWIQAEQDPDTVPVRVASVISLERSMGVGTKLGEGALMGGVGGGVIGLAVETIGAARGCRDESTATCFEVEASDVALVTSLAAAVGAGIGALVGSRMETHHWLGVPLGALRGEYQRDQAGLSVRIVF